MNCSIYCVPVGFIPLVQNPIFKHVTNIKQEEGSEFISISGCDPRLIHCSGFWLSLLGSLGLYFKSNLKVSFLHICCSDFVKRPYPGCALFQRLPCYDYTIDTSTHEVGWVMILICSLFQLNPRTTYESESEISIDISSFVRPLFCFHRLLHP